MVAKNLLKIFSPLFFLFGIIFALIILFLTYFFQLDKSFQNKIYPNVYIDNIDFSGKTKEEVLDYFNKKNQDLQNITITFYLDNQPKASFSATQLNLHYDGETAFYQAFFIGRSNLIFSRLYQKFASLYHFKKFKFSSYLNFDRDLINQYLQKLKDEYDYPAKNALFKFENGKVVSFRKEEQGREIVKEEVIADFEKKIRFLKTKKENVAIIIAPKILKPEITLSSTNNFGIEELIAEGKSDYTHSITSRIHNLKLAATKFNGVLIAPNKTLSFNEILGEVSSSTGYQPAYIIKDGKTVLGDGGGICQVSTTLFRAALNAGLEIVERTAHAYRVVYYENDMEPGFDATVFAPLVDLKIKNNTPAYILIQTEINENNNWLIFKLYGKKDNRRVEISKPIIWDVIPPPQPKYQEDPILKKGVVKQVDFPAWGAKVSFNYKVYKDNKLIIDQQFYSNYRPWQAIYLVGTAD
ncbi:MAG: VanW family protein [Microgenomates group bacterium]